MKYRNVLFALLGTMVSFSTQASSYPCEPTWWINLGMGAGINGSGGGSSQVSFNGTFSEHFFMTLYSGSLTADKHLRDGGLMFGYIDRKPSSYWAASAGISGYSISNDYWSYNGYGYYREDDQHGVGLPLQVQTFWTPYRHFGLGFIGHAVVSEHPYVSGMLAIQVC